MARYINKLLVLQWAHPYPVIDIVLQDFEEKTLKKINVNIPFYYRYVDDVIFAASSDQMSMILDTINNFHNRLQFTWIAWKMT